MLNKKYKIILLVFSVVLLGLVILFFSFKEKKVYTLKSYYPDTKVTDVSEYIIKNGDTVFQGKFTQYNEKGNKIAEGNFVNNEPNGKSIYYFDNGNIKSVHYRKNSKITIENIYYYPSGNIERYILYDEFGNAAFIIRFDERGNIKKMDGQPLIEIYQYKIKYKEQFKIKNNQYLKVGDTLKHQYLLANIPKVKRSFIIENVGIDDTKSKRTITKASQTVFDVKEILTKKGLNTIKAIVQYEFEDKDKTVEKYTLTFEINVN